MKEQKVVMTVMMKNEKARSKALKVVVGVAGVSTAGFEGEEKNQIVVTGTGIDATELTCLLRKKVGHTQLVSVGAADEKKEKKKEEEKLDWPTVWAYQASMSQPYVYTVHNPNPDPCSIL